MAIKIIEKSPYAGMTFNVTCHVCGTKTEFKYSNTFTMPDKCPPQPRTNEDWYKLVGTCLHKEEPLFVLPYPTPDIFRKTFIEPHLGNDGFIKKADYNVIYPAKWNGEKIYYILIDAIVKDWKEIYYKNEH